MPTFAEACDTVIAIHAPKWKPGGKNEQNWRSTMRDYALPRLGRMPVDAVTGSDVMAVLTVCRSAEVRKATWDEIDREAAIWTIPGGRMKAGRAHRVPLSDRVLRVLDEARRELPRSGGLVFPSQKGVVQGHHPTGKLMRRLKIDAVPHGFRSSFRDRAAECTDTPREVCELALAHVNSDRVEAAYRRSDLFERRRTLMQQWADYLKANA
ncbi:MAG: site-specific integrase [Gammaproteobacteria bacterium]|nr:site-specific integrase [Gammaproteobacteria bacterium]